MTKNKAARRCGNIDTRLNHAAAQRLQQQRKYTTHTMRARSAWRPMTQPRSFDATRSSFDANTKAAGRCFAIAWIIGVTVTVIGMAMFGWGV